MLKLLLSLIMAYYVFYLPGYLILKSATKTARHPEMHVVAIGLGAILVPILSFGAAILLGTTVQNMLILIVATFLNLICLLIISKKKHKTCIS